MDRMLYTAMSGASQTLGQQAVVSHNLANVSTVGFRAQLDAMRAVPVAGEARLDTRVSMVASTSGSDFTPGAITRTGRTLDVAIDGEGFLAVQAMDGSEAYTRRGDLQVDSNGLLMSNGLPVIGEGGPIQVPLEAELFIGADGTVSAIGNGQAPDALAEVGRLKLVEPAEAGMLRGADGLFRGATDDNAESPPLAASEQVSIVSGALEGSNVSAVESMVQMINLARRYEMQTQMMTNADENAQKSNSMMSLS